MSADNASGPPGDTQDEGEVLNEFKTTLDMTLDCVFMFTVDSLKFFYVNRGAKNQVGYTEAELRHMTPIDIKPEFDETQFRDMIAPLIRGEREALRFETVHQHKDGHLIPVEIFMQYVSPAHARPRFVAIVRDIGERKTAEKELATYRTKLEKMVAERTRELADITSYNRTLFETTPIGHALCDLDGKLVDVNQAFLDIVGYTEAEVKQLSYWDITPRDYEKMEEVQLQSLQESGHYGPYEKEYLNKAGQRIPVLLNGLLIEKDGEQYIWSSVEDITRRKAVELAMSDATAQAKAAADAKSDFLANMSHEIRTPLNAVLGLARMGAREHSAQKSRELFRRISDSGKHLLQVVNDILDFSKIEAGKLSVERRPLMLARAVGDAVEMIKTQAAGKNLSLSVDIDEELPQWIEGDALRLQQILVNLLSNAVKFTDQGSVGLRLEARDATLLVRVSDTGIGISEQQLQRLFQPFEQADTSTTRRYGGTGLGLAICFNLAAMMGGDIKARSQISEGSEFVVSLPLVKASAPAEPTPRASSTVVGPRLNGVRILAAEDVDLNRLVLTDLLDSEGARVQFAENGQQAVDLVEEIGEDQFDVVLMDIQMPVMDGYTATRRIREIAPELPIIGLTAHALAEERERCFASGMVDHVAKPIDPEQLVAAVLQHCTADPMYISNADPQRHPSTAEEGENAPNGHSADPAQLIDWVALNERYRGRQGFVNKLLTVSMDALTEKHKLLVAAIERRDFEQLHFIAHSLKGTAGSLEAHALFEQAQAVEHAADIHDETGLRGGVRLANTVTAILESIATEIA